MFKLRLTEMIMIELYPRVKRVSMKVTSRDAYLHQSSNASWRVHIVKKEEQHCPATFLCGL